MGLAFAWGAAGSLLGAAASFWLVAVHLNMIPLITAAQCSAALAATYIGGSANLFVVAAYTGLAKDASALGAIAAADVFLMSLYFGGLVQGSAVSHANTHISAKPAHDGEIRLSC